ncbi:hypothetical protein LTR70_008021 [Exophiala xenobiotica]|uniref:Uncharacterized protein n=1 Tax=Lithohypha guttulata TaxID=1690604 RepID=A0ABR0KLI9_9EURO|nr:hypothetical protein LTR24_001124 [Lithohypha guttulata]KAK5312766.1 hypothetical protein LTR70_008021 [Exophiala xenobiotica]
MPSPLTIAGFKATDIHAHIKSLTNNLVNIKDKSGKFLLKLPDDRVIDTKGWNDWEWTHGIGLYGLYQYFSLTSSSDTLAIITSWFEDRFAEGTTKNINTMSPFLTLAYLYEDPSTRQREWLPWLDSWAEWAMTELPRTKYGGFQHMTYLEYNKDELWDDTLMMTVMPLAKIGLVLGRPAYVEEAKRQFLLHVQFLQDKGTGLWFHGWKFDESAEGGLGHNFARARWARGNSWVTIAIPEFLERLDLPEVDSLRMYLEVEALRRLQGDDGSWRTLLDVSEDRGSYVESSATAGFAYGILKAVRKGYISRQYKEVGRRAVSAVVGKISDEGELMDTSFGTGMGYDLEHYLKIEREYALWAGYGDNVFGGVFEGVHRVF